MHQTNRVVDSYNYNIRFLDQSYKELRLRFSRRESFIKYTIHSLPFTTPYCVIFLRKVSISTPQLQCMTLRLHVSNVEQQSQTTKNPIFPQKYCTIHRPIRNQRRLIFYSPSRHCCQNTVFAVKMLVSNIRKKRFLFDTKNVKTFLKNAFETIKTNDATQEKTHRFLFSQSSHAIQKIRLRPTPKCFSSLSLSHRVSDIIILLFSTQ